MIASLWAQLLQPFGRRRELNYRINLSERFRFVYVETPKVGCTTVKASIQQAEGVTGRAGAGHQQVHDKDRSPLLSPSDDFRLFLAYLRAPDVLRFTFVRNPYSRLLSGYLQKISLCSGTLEREGRSGRCRKLKLPEHDEVSFGEFVRAVVSRSPHLLDMHWRPQILLTLPDLIDYSFVGRFERFAADLSQVWDRLGIDRGMTVARQEHRTETEERLQEYYTPEIQSIVYSAYARDFETFGYARDLPE